MYVYRRFRPCLNEVWFLLYVVLVHTYILYIIKVDMYIYINNIGIRI